MLKKTMVLAVAVAGLAALAPSMANASAKNWTNNGEGLESTVTVTAIGTVGFTGSGGGVHCPTAATADLEPGSTGTITSFGASDTAKCIHNGTLASLCASPVTVHQATKLPWTIHATKFSGGQYGIVVTDLEVHVDGTGAFCPNVTVTGNAYLTGSPHEGTTLTVENDNSKSAGTAHRTTAGADHVTLTGEVELALPSIET